ncbi:MAG: LamG domain-containing protein [bacterium]|nr:LamG domain-containing protein [bacterium]
MDDATGTKATDFSGRGYTGTLAGSPIPTWTNGKRGKALDFTSSASANRVLTSSFASITSTITISAWIYPTSYPSERATIVQGQTSNGYYMSLNSDGSLQTYWYGKSSQGYHSSGASTVPLNVWSHVVVVWNTDGPYLYVDGVLKNNVASTGTGTASTVINIGAESTTRQFIGKIDDVRIYSRALGAAEVAALYNSGAARVNATTATRNTGNLGSGLVGHWTFDGQYLNTTTSTDTSGQSNNGTLTGASGAQNNPQPTIGKLGQALKFDGTDDHVDLGTSNSLRPGTGDFSAVAWIKNLDNNQWNSFIGDRNSGSIGTVEGWAMSLRDSGDFSVILEDSALNTKYYDSPATYVDGIWHHLAFTWNAGTEALTLYADGLPLTPTKGSDEALGDISPTTRINIGRQPNNGNPYNGSIDDVRIYNRALSAAEVLQLYNQGK